MINSRIRVLANVEFFVDRRSGSRRNDPGPAVSAALGLVLLPDQRGDDRRNQFRRRGDATSVTEMLDTVQDASIVKTFALGATRERKSALYECGCVIVDPAGGGQLQVLECPTHAALQAKLRRRQTDRH